MASGKHINDFKISVSKTGSDVLKKDKLFTVRSKAYGRSRD